MAELTLNAETARSAGSRPSRRLRRDGRIPAVVYGEGITDPISISVPARDLRTVMSTDAGLNAVVSLQVEGAKYTTMARELQRHPVKGTVLHVDFHVVDVNRPVHADVSINLTGDAVELHRQDGVLEQHLFTLTVVARPGDIPTHIEVDISGLVIGSAVRVAEIDLPSGVKTDVDPETLVVAGLAPRVQVEEAPAVEGAVSGEAGAAGAGTQTGAQAAEAEAAKGASHEES